MSTYVLEVIEFIFERKGRYGQLFGKFKHIGYMKAKFKTKKDIADEEKVVADMVADANKTCKVLGFKEESEKFADCTLKLYTQKVDELVAEKQAANALMTQSQTTTTTQSSGSSSVTIYDPVRDSRALMQQGQKMLSGGCTLGVNC